METVFFPSQVELTVFMMIKEDLLRIIIIFYFWGKKLSYFNQFSNLIKKLNSNVISEEICVAIFYMYYFKNSYYIFYIVIVSLSCFSGKCLESIL